MHLFIVETVNPQVSWCKIEVAYIFFNENRIDNINVFNNMYMYYVFISDICKTILHVTFGISLCVFT